MDVPITGDFVRQILATKNARLARALAGQFLAAIEPSALAGFLLTRDVALGLLADRLRRDPGGTIRVLIKLPGRRGSLRALRGASSPALPRPGRGAPGRKRRKRMTQAEVADLKGQVKAFLAKHRWATRRQLTQVVDLPTQAIYRRIMEELQNEGHVISRGIKANVTYALKGAGGGRKGKPAGRAQARKVGGNAKRKGAGKSAAKGRPAGSSATALT